MSYKLYIASATNTHIDRSCNYFELRDHDGDLIHSIMNHHAAARIANELSIITIKQALQALLDNAIPSSDIILPPQYLNFTTPFFNPTEQPSPYSEHWIEIHALKNRLERLGFTFNCDPLEATLHQENVDMTNSTVSNFMTILSRTCPHKDMFYLD